MDCALLPGTLAVGRFSNKRKPLVKLEVWTGTIRVHDVWAAIDCGIALQPANVAAQVEGNIIFGMSQALHERISVKGSAVQQSNFHDTACCA